MVYAASVQRHSQAGLLVHQGFHEGGNQCARITSYHVGKDARSAPFCTYIAKAKTEESYLNAYKRFRKYSGCEIEPSHHTDPVGLVTEAIKAKESSPPSDCHWVAYDLEDVSLEKRRQALEEAYRLAEANGINIALSAISFEVWLLLHFTSTPKTYLNCDGAVRALKVYLPNYAKGNSGIFEKLQELLPNARKNADSLQRRQERDNPDSKPYERNPYTSFHLLLNASDQIDQIK